MQIHTEPKTDAYINRQQDVYCIQPILYILMLFKPEVMWVKDLLSNQLRQFATWLEKFCIDAMCEKESLKMNALRHF